MTKTAAIVGLSFGGITNSICNAFRTLGWDALPFLYDPPPRNALLRKWDKFTDTNKSLLALSFNTVLRERVIPLLRSGSVTMILILRGEKLDSDIQDELQSSRVPLFSWAYDSLDRFPGQKDCADIAQHAFFIDLADANTFGNRGSWLPLGYDNEIYRPHCRFEEKDIDILLSGALSEQYSARRNCIREISRSPLVDRYKIAFVGSTGTRFADFLFRRSMNISWLAQYTKPEIFALFVSRAKIYVNIHQDDGIAPVNPMFFAIPGSGTCQVAEAKPYLTTWLDSEREYVPFNDGFLVAELERLLANQPLLRKICDAGLQAATLSHTFVQRIAAIIEYL